MRDRLTLFQGLGSARSFRNTGRWVREKQTESRGQGELLEDGGYELWVRASLRRSAGMLRVCTDFKEMMAGLENFGKLLLAKNIVRWNTRYRHQCVREIKTKTLKILWAVYLRALLSSVSD